ncbi:MAG: transposase [Clostridiales bacterium]|nr:transposase [Clostridiales bacterium]
MPKRKHPRLKSFDYSTPGAYFVTICTQNKRCLLSSIVGRGLAPAENHLTEYGKIAMEQLFLLEKRYDFLKIDQYVIMPNHVHVIFILSQTAGASPRPTMTDIVCAYKSLTTRECKKVKPIDKLFQTSFYEHVVRGQEDYDEIAEYIVNNPKKWELDKLYAKE